MTLRAALVLFFVSGAVTLQAAADWTVMVYMAADNDLESYALEDFAEMASVGSTGDVNVVVQLDRAVGYDSGYGDWTGARRGRISNGDVPDDSWGADLGEVNMGDGATLREFIQWAASSYPADRYALILWNHGTGWRSRRSRFAATEEPVAYKSVCEDVESGDVLRNKEIEESVVASGTTPELIGFDACLMGMVEVACQTRRTGASVMVGSEATEPGDGWDYAAICGALNAAPTSTAPQLGAIIVDAYFDQYGRYTLSAIDLGQVETLTTRIDQLARTALESPDDFTALKGAANGVLECYDANGLVIRNRVGSDYPRAKGLSINFPVDGCPVDYQDSTISFAADTAWDEMLTAYPTLDSSRFVSARSSAQMVDSVYVDLYDFCQLLANGGEPTMSYGLSLIDPSFMGGGTGQSWRGDDKVWDYALPFTFPFYGNDYTTARVSSNGHLNLVAFSDPDDCDSSTQTLINNVRVAPLWTDLNTSSGDVYVHQPDADSICFRWEGVDYNSNAAVSFEAVLRRDGQIQFNYAAGANDSVTNPVVGVSAGDGVNYEISSYTGQSSLDGAKSVIWTPEVDVTLTASPPNSGTLSLGAGTIKLNPNADHMVIAAPATGYEFSSWGHDPADGLTNVAENGAELTFRPVKNVTVTASFSLRKFNIAASAGMGGSVSPSGTVSVDYGSDQTFTIQASSGYALTSLTIDGESVTPTASYTFANVTGDHALVAGFTPTHVISASAGVGGSVAPSGSVEVVSGSDQTFVIQASSGYELTSLKIDGESVTPTTSYTFSNVSSTHSLVAGFTRQYTITASAGTGGSVSPSGSVEVLSGANQTFSIKAEAGYVLTSLTIDGEAVTPAMSYAFENVTDDHTLTVGFTRLWTITATAGDGGSVNPSGTISLMSGASQTFLMRASSDYALTSLTIDGESVTPTMSYTFENVTGDHALVAGFTRLWKITATATDGGSVIPSGSVTAWNGSDQTFSISARSGYALTSLTIDGKSVTPTPTHTFSNVTSDHSLVAKFNKVRVITVSTGEGGTVSPSGSVTVTYGSDQTFAIQASSGYELTRLTIDGKTVAPRAYYMFVNVTIDHTIKADFTRLWTITASAGVGGSVSPTGSVSVLEGTDQTFAIRADQGYELTRLLVDGVEVPVPGTYVFESVSSDHALSAEFTKAHVITATAGEGGSVSPNGSVSVLEGADQTFAIRADQGYELTRLLVDGAEVPLSGTYVFESVSSDHALSAEFTKAHAITASAGEGGSVSPSGSVSVLEGTDQAFSIRADQGYELTSLRVDGEAVALSGTYVFKTVSSDHALEAGFSRVYAIATTAGVGGTVSPSGMGTVLPGTDFSVTITADEGYVIGDVLVDGASVGATGIHVFKNVQSDHELSAEFVAADQAVELTLTSSGEGNGAVTPPAGTYRMAENETITASAAPAEGREFAGWTLLGDLTPIKRDGLSITVEVGGDGELVANFVAGDAGEPTISVWLDSFDSGHDAAELRDADFPVSDFDPDNQSVSVRIDQARFDCDDGQWETRSDGSRIFSSNDGEPRTRLVIDPERRRWHFTVREATLCGQVGHQDGLVLAELIIGDQAFASECAVVERCVFEYSVSGGRGRALAESGERNVLRFQTGDKTKLWGRIRRGADTDDYLRLRRVEYDYPTDEIDFENAVLTIEDEAIPLTLTRTILGTRIYQATHAECDVKVKVKTRNRRIWSCWIHGKLAKLLKGRHITNGLDVSLTLGVRQGGVKLLPAYRAKVTSENEKLDSSAKGDG